MKTCCAMLVRSVMVALIAGTVLAVMPGQALAGNIYDSQVLQRIKFAPALRRKVRAVLRQSDREMAAIFRKYGINPNAKPKRKSFGMIFLPNMRIVNITNLIFVIKCYQQRTIANGNISHISDFGSRISDLKIFIIIY